MQIRKSLAFAGGFFLLKLVIVNTFLRARSPVKYIRIKLRGEINMSKTKQLRRKKRSAEKTITKMIGVMILSIFFLVGTAGAFDMQLIALPQALLQAVIAMISIIGAQMTVCRKETTKDHLDNRIDRLEQENKKQHTVIRNKQKTPLLQKLI